MSSLKPVAQNTSLINDLVIIARKSRYVNKITMFLTLKIRFVLWFTQRQIPEMASEKKDGGGKFVISFLRQLDGKLCLGLDCGALNIGSLFSFATVIEFAAGSVATKVRSF